MQQGMSDAAGMLGEGAQPNLRARIVVSPTSTLYSRSTAHLKRDESSFNLISLELKQTVSSYRNWNMYLIRTETNCVSYRNWNMYLGRRETKILMKLKLVSFWNNNLYTIQYLVGSKTYFWLELKFISCWNWNLRVYLLELKLTSISCWN